MALDVANKTDDSGFWSSFKESPRIEVLMGAGTQWTGVAPMYPVGMLVGSLSFLSSSCLAMRNKMVLGMSFDDYVQKTTGRSGIGELIGGQALLKDYTSQLSWNNCRSWPMSSWILHAASTRSFPTWHLPSSKRCRRHSWAQVVSLRSLAMTWPQLV